MVGAVITYHVTQNPDACHEVRLPRLTKPPQVDYTHSVNVGYCHYDIRTAGEMELYMTTECGGVGRDKFWPVKEKYAVDLSRPNSVRRIDEKAWEAAPPLPRATEGGYFPRADQSGVQVRGGPILERSGPKWTGIGQYQPVKTSLSWTMNRAAVNSWDGYDITYSILDPTALFKRNRIKGQYWVDIYDAAAGRSLVKIQGSFKEAGPYDFQGQAAWYSDRYYVLPLGPDVPLGELGMRRLLICDLDAASRKDDQALKYRK